VDNNGIVAAVDALILINEINTGGNRDLPPVPRGSGQLPPFLDVSGDGRLAPVDVLNVIDYINNHSSPGGEGEAPRDEPAPVGAIYEYVLIREVDPNVTVPAGAVRLDSALQAVAADAVFNSLGSERTVEGRRSIDASTTGSGNEFERTRVRRRLVQVDQTDLVDAALTEWDPILPGLARGIGNG
jgi:hypothetical protein